MTRRVVFFTNSKSHGIQKKGSRLKAIYDARQQSSDIYLNAQSPQQTSDDFRKLTLTPQDHLFIEGGDGTMQRTLSCLLNSLDNIKNCPMISIIAGGLTNQIAANIGLKATHDKYIKAAIEAPEKGLKPTSVLQLTSHDMTPLFGCLFSSGALPFVTEYYEAQVRANQTGGKMAIAGTLLKVISGNRAARDKVMPATTLSLNINMLSQSRTKTGPHLGTIVTTLPSVMMGLDPFWDLDDIDENTGALRLLYADARARRLLRNLIGLWLGRKSLDRSGDGLESYRAQDLSFHYDGPLVLDGEPVDFNGAPFSIIATPPLPFVTTPAS